MQRMRWVLIPLLVLVAVSAPAAPLVNQLKKHSSPYLALHGEDPVAWQEWNAATVARARAEGKLLFVSIGYFSCHWCHVMQRESYRNADIAKLLNERFIPVKVDRELDPALDARLIEFAEKTQGRSGWPLNVFVTPAGHPLFATLYHPPQEFMQVVQRIDGLWREQRAQLESLAKKEAGPPKRAAAIAPARLAQLAASAEAEVLKDADIMQGGFSQESKFPSVPQLAFLLAREAAQSEPKRREYLRLTLDVMARRGLRDHLGGGFFRYTVDPSWKTPHFEKMLNDNAQLARLYLDAARVLKQPDYQQVARDTLDFMLSVMSDKSGGFIAALSALDDKDVEGGYYLWSANELERVLSADERNAYRAYNDMTGAPPFEQGWLPMLSVTVDEVAKSLKREPAAIEALLKSANEKLRKARARRGLPRDTKVIAAWNGLVLTAFAEAAQATNDARYRDTARALRDVLVTRHWDGKALRRTLDGGTAVLEDYAYVAEGLAAWAALTGKPEDRDLALTVARSGWQRFYRDSAWRLEETSLLAENELLSVISDGVMASPSAVLAAVTLRLAGEAGDTKLRDQARAALRQGDELISANLFWHVTPIRLLGSAF
jgi:hypothetical protein